MMSSITLTNDYHRRHAFHNFNYVISKFNHYIEFIKSSKYNETNQYIDSKFRFSKISIQKL